MSRRRRNNVSPSKLRETLGDSLKGAWFLDERHLLANGDLRDVSGNGHHGTPTAVQLGQRSLAPGLVGGSGYFDGVSSKIATPYAPNFAGKSWTFLFWLMSENDGGFDMMMDFGSSSGVRIFFNGTAPHIQATLRDINENTSQILTSSGFKGEPTLVAFVVDQATDDAGWVINGKRLSGGGDISALADLKPASSMTIATELRGSLQAVALAEEALPIETLGHLTELSGIKNAPAYYQPFYVSDYPDSPRRYFANYLDDYLEARFKPAIEVWPKRRYGVATARGVKGAHDGVFLDAAGSGPPTEDDAGLAFRSHLEVNHHADVDFTDGSQHTLLATSRFSAPGERYFEKRGGSSEGYLFYINGNAERVAMIVSDGVTNEIELGGDFPLVGEETFVATTVDRVNGELKIYDAKGLTNPRDISALGSFENTVQLNINGNRSPDMGVAALVPYILSEAELTHLNEAAFDASKRYDSKFRFYEPLEATDPDLFAQMRYPVYAGAQVLYQDAAATVPVTTIGELIGAVKNPFTGQVVLTQSDPAAKPTWGGPDKGAVFDGVDDHLEVATPYIGDGGNFSAFASVHSVSGPGALFSGGQTYGYLHYLSSTNGLNQYNDGTPNLEGGQLNNTYPGVTGGYVENQDAYLVNTNGLEDHKDAFNYYTPPTGNLTIGARASANMYLEGNIRWVCVANRQFTDAEGAILRENP